MLEIQKRVIRTIAGLQWCRTAFKELKVLTAVALYVLETVIYTISTGPNRLADYHNYRKIKGHDFSLPLHHLSIYEKKPLFRGAVYFNAPPN